MLGTLDFAGLEHWAPFNFPKSTALLFSFPPNPLPLPPPPHPPHQVKEGPHQVHLLRPHYYLN